jgi:class 3 adenylate cyclase/ribosomal protein L40E
MAGLQCLNCGYNNPSDARFCQECGKPLEIACPNCGASNAIRAKFCKNCGYALGANGSGREPSQENTKSNSYPKADPRYDRLAASTPVSLVEKMKASAHRAGERRVVTALFADVVGSTSLAEQMDPEDWTGIMNRAFDLLTPVIYRYEGSIARLMGDALLAFFGAPVAHEDDPARAVRAALDLVTRGKEYSAELRRTHGIDFSIRVGLNTGHVVVGEVGSNLAYEYTAMGDAVNLAARLQSAARPMTVLIGESTYRFVKPIFDCTSLGEISIKGKAEPVRVYEVIGIKARAETIRGLPGLESPLIGREDELDRLLQATQATMAGLGRAVLILGEPGIGKSRLVTEWRLRSQEVRGTDRQDSLLQWAVGRCLSYGQGLAYHLIIDLLRSLLGLPDSAGEQETNSALYKLCEDQFADRALEVYPYLGHLLSLNLEGEASAKVQGLDPQAIQGRYLAALHQLLKSMAKQKPLALVLEDIQLADPSSTEFLIKLLPLIPEAPVLMCCVTRLEHDAPGWKLIVAMREMLGAGLTEIQLRALSEVESSQLVSQMLRADILPDHIRKTVFEKTEGNPLFVEEVVRMLVDRNILVKKQDGWATENESEALDVPDNLQGLLQARIDRLPEDVKHTLRVASVIGKQFSMRVLEDVLAIENRE